MHSPEEAMGDFFSKIISQVQEIFGKLDNTKKMIVGAVAVVVIVAFSVLFSVSTGEPNVLLFSKLSAKDYGQVTKKLEEMGYFYKTSGGASVFVKPKQREVILTKLAQENMIPKGIPGWKLFDISKWTETDRELDVKYVRALRDEIKRHIQSLKNIQKASVDISMGKESIYTKKAPYTAAITVHLAPGYEKLSRKEVKGIVRLVTRAIGNRMKDEDVTITDDHGKILSIFDSDMDKTKEKFKMLEYRRKEEDKIRMKYLSDIKRSLGSIYTEDRIQIVRLNMEFNWDIIKEEKTVITPIVERKDDPTTPYSELKTKEKYKISESTTKENFKGHGFNPKGPPGVGSNKTPGYKAADDQYTVYNKSKNIVNYDMNKTKQKIEREAYRIKKITVAIAIDGKQNLPILADGSYDLDPKKDPVQVPLKKIELKKAESVVKTAIGFSEARGDQVAVENIMFDRSKYWNALREEFRKREQMKKLLLAALVGVVALFIGFILFRTVQKELERRRRAREEQLALEQQKMREAALRIAEEEGIDVELSLEEKARLELKDNAIRMAKERPDDVAALLRTWLAEE